jgi:cobaltochelatase CobS
MKIKCELCGALIHSVEIHLREAHTEVTVKEYQEKFPAAPMFSERALELLKAKREALADTGKATPVKPTVSIKSPITDKTKFALIDVFGIPKKGNLSAWKNISGDDIMVSKLESDGEFNDLIPSLDKSYVFLPELVKNVMLGIELNIPTYLWGHAGTGKSSLIENICAVTNRRYIRVQHTMNTEESHISGQILANKDGTYFEPGPLALAMKHGFVYNADEYDFAHASVLAVYQAVLEGKPLVIKEAPSEWRVVKPHKDFRFVATGNTNGSGDETMLYAGTNMGNSANYSRFGITQHVEYMLPKLEIQVLAAQAGLKKPDAKKLVDFAKAVREAYNNSKMTTPIGTRELIYSARVGIAKGSWTTGIRLAYINRLASVDREIAFGICQRIFDESVTDAPTEEPDIEEQESEFEISF